MRLIAAILVLLAMLVAPSQAAQEGRRVALVLGNGDYRQVPALANPRADAAAIGAALERLGFDVELGLDLDLAGMRRAVQGFSRKLQGADMALFFYAGHGLQVHGQNYLLPVDAALETEADLDFAALPARLVLAQMERWPAIKIVMLDACRDNPFADALKRTLGANRSSAVSRGLAPIETAGGTLLAYATDPGDVASDGDSGHSPFTAALLKHVETPGVEINTMLARVRAEVYATTRQQQRPWTETSLIGEVYLAPKAPEPPPMTQAMLAPRPPAEPVPPHSGLDPRAIELALWEAAQSGGTAADYREYLRQYPSGIFARLAQIRLTALQAAEGAVQDDSGPLGPDALGGQVEPRMKNVPSQSAPDSAGGPANGGAEAGAGSAPGVPEGGAGTTDGAMPPIPKTGQAGTPQEPHGEMMAAVPEAAQGMAAGSVALGADATRAPEAVESALGLDPGQRREVQARLLVAGHDPRGVDGIFGPGTRAALAAWQAAEGLAATGYLDAAGLARLEQGTQAAYAVYVERQRQFDEARRAAARAEAERRAEKAAAAAALRTAPVAAAPATVAPVTVTPAPTATAPAPQPVTPTVEAAESKDDGRSVRERYSEECHFVFTGSTTLERRCKTGVDDTPRLGQRR